MRNLLACTLGAILLGAAGPATGSDYFPCRVHNDQSTKGIKSAFAVLGETEGFSLEDALERKGIENIFIIINGQQVPCGKIRLGKKADILFGADLTGAHRVGSGGEWKGRYRIFTTRKHPSVASRIHDEFKGNSLVVSVVNPKLDWGDRRKDKRRTVEYMRRTILRLVKETGREGETPSLFICGFSRGGVFSYWLADLIKGESDIKAVVTVDPVINPLSNERKWVKHHAVFNRRKEAWVFRKRYNPVLAGPTFFFPVLRELGVPQFNVFQRRGLFSPGGGSFGLPIGSGMEGATAPCRTHPDLCAPLLQGDKDRPPLDQFDASIAYHAPDMLAKYADWVFDIAKRTMTPPGTDEPESTSREVEPGVSRIWGRRRVFTGESIRLQWRGNQRGLEYRWALARKSGSPQWSDWGGGRKLQQTMDAPGSYGFLVQARREDGTRSEARRYSFLVVDRPPRITALTASREKAFPMSTVTFSWRGNQSGLTYRFRFSALGEEGPPTVVAEGKTGKTQWTSPPLRERKTHVLSLRAFSPKGRPSPHKRHAVEVFDVLLPDEVFVPVSDRPAEPRYTIAVLKKRPGESESGLYEAAASMTTLDWEENTLFKRSRAILFSYPATPENLSVGDKVLRTRWNEEDPDQVRTPHWLLGEVVGLDRLEEGLVTIGRRKEPQGPISSREAVLLFNVRRIEPPQGSDQRNHRQ